MFPGTRAMCESRELTYAAGTLLDYVRGSVTCRTEAEVVAAKAKLEERFTVVRVKNTHHPDAPTVGGYRDVKVFVVVGCAVGGVEHRMVCEVQLLLASFLKVKKSMHLLYALHRGDFD